MAFSLTNKYFIENQLHDEIGVREIYEKLQKEEELTPHAARACIARVFIIDFFAVLKEHKPFELEAYVRRLSLIGTDVSNLGRNERCPCGSGAKFKRCCAPYAEALEVFYLAGRLDLGYGSYILMLSMLYYTVFGKGLDDLGNRFPSIEAAIHWVISDPVLYGELMDLLEYQYVKIDLWTSHWLNWEMIVRWIYIARIPRIRYWWLLGNIQRKRRALSGKAFSI